MADAAVPTVLLAEDEIAARVEALADRIAPRIDDDTVAVCLLTGGLWFAADLMRALARRGRHPLFDALWIASYGDDKRTSGRVIVRAGLQRSVEGRQVLLLDDVFDSGLSIAEAAKIVGDAGARAVPGRLRHGCRRPPARRAGRAGDGLKPPLRPPRSRRPAPRRPPAVRRPPTAPAGARPGGRCAALP